MYIRVSTMLCLFVLHEVHQVIWLYYIKKKWIIIIKNCWKPAIPLRKITKLNAVVQKIECFRSILFSFGPIIEIILSLIQRISS